jgi:hypothetical protein
MKESELKMDRHNRPIQKSELEIHRLYRPIQSEHRIGIGRSINRTFRPPMGAGPPHFTLSTIMSKVVMYAPAERADTLPQYPCFSSTPISCTSEFFNNRNVLQTVCSTNNMYFV